MTTQDRVTIIQKPWTDYILGESGWRKKHIWRMDWNLLLKVKKEPTHSSDAQVANNSLSSIRLENNFYEDWDRVLNTF